MSGFTKGPWVSHGKSVMATGTTDTYSGAVLGPIAHMNSLDEHDDEGRNWWTNGSPEANAHLIAAAPDMYEALQPLVDAAKHNAADAVEWNDKSTISIIFSIGDLRAAMSALAKAEGKSC